MVGPNWPSQGELGKSSMCSKYIKSTSSHTSQTSTKVYTWTLITKSLYTRHPAAPRTSVPVVKPATASATQTAAQAVVVTAAALSLTLQHPTVRHSTPTAAAYTQACGQAQVSKYGTLQAEMYPATSGTEIQTRIHGAHRLQTTGTADAISMAGSGI
jgi:hypothetical protein